MDGIRGWSGRVLKYLSRAFLNVSVGHPVRLRTSEGRELNMRGPLWVREENLIVLILSGAEGRTEGTTHMRPLRSLKEA